MISLYAFHEYILNYHNILDFWNVKNLASQSILHDYGLITAMLSWMNFFDIKSSVMPLILRNTILKDFENHKLRYIMKYIFLYKIFYSFELMIQLLIF